MLLPERYSQEEFKKIQRACCHIFMSEKVVQPALEDGKQQRILRYPFLEQLTYDDVKRAYRANVLTYHPDRHQDKHPDDLDFFRRHIEVVNRSYEYLSTLFGGKRSAALIEYTTRNRIIAVGGAKGGIGKSLFSANLGMVLSQLGYKTVLVDLDLGGSNLHIYLGLNQMPSISLSDFLNNRVAGLHETMVRLRRGLALIAGNTHELGSANIAFQKKRRLIENLKQLDADYIILDLGGRTDFNTLDFFLAADAGIVLTTLEQPAYLEAYAFIKNALQRKLHRLFGVDSPFPARRNAVLKNVVLEGTRPPEKDNPRTIQGLLEHIATIDPLSLAHITDEILSFTPSLVVNNCHSWQEAGKVVNSIRSVGCRRLSIDIDHVGSISRHAFMERCTSYFHHPLVSRSCAARYTDEIYSIATRLGLA